MCHEYRTQSAFYLLLQYLRTCAVRFRLCSKRLPQASHVRGPLSLCVNLWVLRLSSRLNRLGQIPHSYGFSPLCIDICLARCPPCLNRLGHLWHQKRLSLLDMSFKVFSLGELFGITPPQKRPFIRRLGHLRSSSSPLSMVRTLPLTSNWRRSPLHETKLARSGSNLGRIRRPASTSAGL